MMHSQLLTRLKSESKYKTSEGGGVRARSLTHNTLRGRGACQSSGMELGRVDKLHSLTWACTQPTQSGQCIVGTFLVLGRTTGNMNTQDSPQPRLGGSHHLPPYSILCTSPRSLHPNGFSLLGLPRGSPEIAPTRTPTTLEPHNFASRPRIQVRSKAKLQLLSRAFQRYVAGHQKLFNGMSHVVCSQVNWVNSQLFLIENQTDNLTPDSSFGHNLCFRCSNEQCKPILNIYVPRAFQ